MDETLYRYLSMDADHDLSANTLTVGLTPDAFPVVATYQPTPPIGSADVPPPETGLTRYWWRVLVGPGETLDPEDVGAPLTIYGRMVDGAEVRLPVWPLGEAEAEHPPFSDPCWPVDIPDECMESWRATPYGTRARAEVAAVETLRYLTGGQVGGCSVTVQIARGGCCGGTPTWRTYPAGGFYSRGGDRGFRPVLADGVWLNIGCGGGCGNGCPLPACLPLPETIRTATAVTIDSVVFTDYVQRGSRLYRTDDQAWPSEGVAVTGIPGWPVDGQGASAAGVLACEYAKSMTGKGKCALPAGVTQVVRAGVTINLAEGGGLFPGGLTGLREVDVFTARYNPHRLSAAPTVWTPDLVR